MAEIFRDARGVPHVRATDVLDLADAQGEVTARDRGWQIETDRLRSTGRLAELIGEAGAAWDVFARRARIDDTARQALAAAGDETRAFVAAYSAGVRRGMQTVGCRAPEFAELDRVFGDRFDLDPWADHDPLGVLHVAHVLFTTFPRMLWREHVAATLGDDWVDVLGGDLGESAAGEDAAPTSGSNGWALHGSRTDTGAPILGGDPHRMFELPGVYQQIRLACDAFDVVGLAFPGVPGVPHFGHTGDAAWGVTNAMAHSVDVFRERLRHGPYGYEALGPDGWEPVDVQHSVVRVRGGASIPVDAFETARGPIVTDLRPVAGSEGEWIGWSIRMPVRSERDLGADALLPLLRARTADDVVAAFGRWVDPVNRVLTADTDGTVLSATVGVVPDRPRPHRRLPLDAAVDAVASVRRPAAATRVADVAVDANEHPGDAANDLGWAYAPPHRANRIRDLIEERRPSTVDDFDPIWGDVDAAGARALLRLLPDGELAPDAAAVRDQLRAWDGRMDPDSAAAGRFAAWRAALVRAVTAHPALVPLHAPHGYGEIFTPWLAVTAHVAASLPGLLARPELRADAHRLSAAALAEAATADSATGAWGDAHRLHAAHLLADVPGAEDPGEPLAIALPGDGDTVRCTGSTPGLTDRAWRGSVARWAWDLSDRDHSRWGVPFGAAGDGASPHFADQLDTWTAGSAERLVTDWSYLRADVGTGAA